jgi:hypothetical protein
MTDSPLTTEALATWTDEEVVDAWKSGTWTSRNLTLDALAVEMERQGLSF